jgi:DNA-binding beta-propeller fold protein YncE
MNSQSEFNWRFWLKWDRLLAAVVVFTFIHFVKAAEPSHRIELISQFRRPVAMVLASENDLLFVANQRSGTISTIDTTAFRIIGETEIGQNLSDLLGLPDSKTLLATDPKANELLVLTREKDVLNIIARLSVGNSPVSVTVSKEGSIAFVASLWAREISIIDLVPSPAIRKRISLPFAPRKQALLDGKPKLVVADSFGGNIAVIDLGRTEIESVRTIPVHNIRGLTLSRKSGALLVAGQTLNRHAQTTVDDIHWGNLMANNLRVFSMEALLDAKSDMMRGSYSCPLGEPGEGGADPSSILEGPEGQLIATLGGAGKMALVRNPNSTVIRFSVGQRPVSLALATNERTLFIANWLSDTISVFDLNFQNLVATIPLGPQPEASLADRGEALFYDGTLSHNGWLSCNSCHTDGHSNGQLNDNLGDGSYGAAKRVLSLLGVRDTAPWAWNGGIAKLEDQIRNSIQTTMRGKASDEQVAALTEFLKTLDPPPRLSKSGESAARGELVFRQQGCAKCHAAPQFTTPKIYDVGLHDEVGNSEFNPPSLRGISQRDSFFHDSRAHDLASVFTQFHHGIKAQTTDRDLQDLMIFLRGI